MRRLIAVSAFLLLAGPAWAEMPFYVGSGTFTTSLTTCQAPFNVPTQVNDIALLVAESENETISLSSAQGFVQVTNSPQGAGTAATNPANAIAVYWKRIDLVGGGTAPTVGDSGNHTTCQIHIFRGVKLTGDPWNITAGGNDGGSNDTTAVIPGATTTASNCLVAIIEGTSFNGTSTEQCGAATNADLANITERSDNTHTVGLGGGHCLITGEKASAGAYTDTTLTLANTSFKGAMSIALEGAVNTGVWVRSAAGNPGYSLRTNTTLVAPAGIENDNILLLFFVIAAQTSAPTPTPPSGFTVLTGFPNDISDGLGFNVDYYAWRKIASGESGDYTITHTSATTDAFMYVLAGADTTTPINPNPTLNEGTTGTTTTALGLTTAIDNSLVIFATHNWDEYNDTASPPTGTTPTFTERLNSTGILYLADGLLATAGATGNKSHENQNTSQGCDAEGECPWFGSLVAVAASSGAPPPAPPRMTILGVGP